MASAVSFVLRSHSARLIVGLHQYYTGAYDKLNDLPKANSSAARLNCEIASVLVTAAAIRRSRNRGMHHYTGNATCTPAPLRVPAGSRLSANSLTLPDQGVAFAERYDRNSPANRGLGYARVGTYG